MFEYKWPFVRKDVIANGGIWRSWKIVIYRLHRADLYGTKECNGVKAAQFSGYVVSYSSPSGEEELELEELEEEKEKTKCGKCHGCFLCIFA